MNYAITVTADGLITGRHESMTPINSNTFANNTAYVGQSVTAIQLTDDFQAGHWLADIIKKLQALAGL